MSEGPFHRIAVVGLGLIGGSLVKTLRRVAPQCELIGVDFPEVLAQARKELDAAFAPEQLHEALAAAELVFLATPISTIVQLIPSVARAVPPGAVVTDAGSTKAVILTHALRHFANGAFFIGGHPMAGREHGGWEHADAHLFENAAYALAPLADVPESIVWRLQNLLEAFGARVVLFDPREHDRLVAETSHLPQLLAVALADFIARADEATLQSRAQLSGSGLRDMTRLAASPFALWQDILRSNHENVAASLQIFITHLQQIAENFEHDELQSRFENAHRLRNLIAPPHSPESESSR